MLLASSHAGHDDQHSDDGGRDDEHSDDDAFMMSKMVMIGLEQDDNGDVFWSFPGLMLLFVIFPVI